MAVPEEMAVGLRAVAARQETAVNTSVDIMRGANMAISRTFDI
jgi:hypothetical protein